VFHRALDLVFACFVALVILWFVWEARDWSFHSRLFPWSVGITVLILALAQVALSVRNFRFVSSKDDVELKVSPADHQAAEVEQSGVWRLVTIGIWIALFFLGIWLFGFRLGSLVLTIAFLKVAAKEGYKESLTLGLVNYLFFLIIFDFALGVPLLEGAIAQWLGIESLDGFVLKELRNLWT
jgi:beta-lactamase regulating signal transducer with metallopeptidase domain